MKLFSSLGKITVGLLLIAAAGCSRTAKVQTSPAVARTKVPASVPAGYRVVKDLPYYPKDFRPLSGDAEYAAERCKLDIYIPQKKVAEPLPVLLFFHGGGLSRGSKGMPRGQRGLPAEFIIVTANYRLSGSRAKCPDYLNDAAAAAAWTVRNIARYGGDPDKVFVTGASAGGYLSAMIALDRRWLKPFGLDPRKCFAGVLPISGQMSTHFQVMIERGQAGQPLVDEYAPIYHAAADTPPIVLFCGQPDIEFKARVAENLFFHAVLTQLKKNPDAKIHQINGFNHSSVGVPAGYLTRQEMKRILRQRKAAQKAARL